MTPVVGPVLDRLAASPRIFELSQALTDPFRIVPLRRLLAKVPHSSLLDLGCGTGDLCGMTAAAYTGIDRSSALIDYARRRYGNARCRFEVGDALSLDGSLASHDLVVISSMIHHLSDDEVRRCLSGLSPVRPRRLLLVDIALESAGPVFRHVMAPLDRGRHFRTTEALREIMISAGWRMEREDRWRSLSRLFPYVALLAAPA